MKNKHYICLLIAILLVPAICNAKIPRKRKKQETTQPVIIHTDCDSLINEALASIDTEDTADNYTESLKLEIIKLSVILSECKNNYAILSQKPVAEKPCPPTTVINGDFKPKTKTKKSGNTTTSRSNNTTTSEIIKLKNSMLIKDSQIDSLTVSNVAFGKKVDRLNDVIIGNENTISKLKTKAGNIIWIIILSFIVGILTGTFGFRILKTYFPFLKFLP
jgi:hypothetical protein